MTRKNYEKDVVIVQDGLIAAHSNIVAFGVLRRPTEIHIEFYLKQPDGKIFHRDIELQPDGSYDSGSLISQDIIVLEMKSKGIGKRKRNRRYHEKGGPLKAKGFRAREEGQ